MPSEVFKALIADSLSTMSHEQLSNIIRAMMEKPNTNIDDVGAVVLAEKAKKGALVNEGTSAGQNIEPNDVIPIVAATEEGSVVSREATGEGVQRHPVGQEMMAERSGKRKHTAVEKGDGPSTSLLPTREQKTVVPPPPIPTGGRKKKNVGKQRETGNGGEEEIDHRRTSELVKLGVLPMDLACWQIDLEE